MAYYIYGRNTVVERLTNNKDDVKRILVQEGLKDARVLKTLEGLEYETVSKSKLDRLTNSEHHQGIACEINTYDYVSLDEVIKIADSKEYPLIVMLDSIEDPHNLGAIMRTCEALGCNSIIVPKFGSAPLTSTVAKVSTGAIEYVKVASVTNLTNTINYLKEKGYWIVGAEANGSVDYRKIDYKTKICLVMGSEGKGIAKLVVKQCDFLARLPMSGHVNSLNVSNATAVLLYQIHNNRYPAE